MRLPLACRWENAPPQPLASLLTHSLDGKVTYGEAGNQSVIGTTVGTAIP